MSSANTAGLEASVFASRIGTNYAATDDEVGQLKDLLSVPTAGLDKLQEEIERISSQLDKLHSNRRVLFRKVDAHRALMSPMRRMPVDIIREIFLRCLPTQHNPVMSRHHAPVLLAQICSSWRHIAHSTPLLWSAIYIVVPWQLSDPLLPPSSLRGGLPATGVDSALEATHRRAAGIAQWLGRAADCPLDIVIYDRDRRASEAAYEVILTAVIPFSRRWQTIHFQMPSYSLSRVAALSEADVPMLRSLTIYGQDVSNVHFPGMSQGQVPKFQFLLDSGLLKAPQLRQIVYTRVTEDFLRFPLRWEQLTVISLAGCVWTAPEYLSLGRVAQILQCCSGLVKCTLEISLPPGGLLATASNTIGPVRLLSLETITLQSPTMDLALLFQVLEVPALRELEFYVSPGYSDDGTFVQEVVLFLKRTSSTLRSLTMDPFFIDKGSLHTCLRSCHGLQSLSLRSSHLSQTGYVLWMLPPQHIGYEDLPASTVDDDLLMSFIDDTDPQLEKLESFECTVDAAISDDVLLSFIRAKQSKGGSCAPLKRVAMTLQRPQELPMASALRQYVQGGLDCRLIYTPSVAQGTFSASEGIINDPSHRPWGLLSFEDGNSDND